ncbi:hypothetical protein P22_1354 [Propionispora sp. 2/2-37]|uniref:MBL fold metallo-hydrolase n=1 Tax=Propionispora sp. 2/2-37 TaxID=1677858 RepID=UPI0006C474F3|nr:MBL fold metallo-hydrolase [Propionispora sp. 2/2-37]CUH95284.1 hypothetical protein P22_1354 [Propionispora sp. 2/2-37]
MIVFLSVVAGIILLSGFFLIFNPRFGGKASKNKLRSFSQSVNFSENKFVNQIPTPNNLDAKNLMAILREYWKGSSRRTPAHSLPVMAVNAAGLQNQSQTRMIWFGHSTILLEIEGKRVLLDPMFSQRPSPFPKFGAKRYSDTLPIEIEKLPAIDVIVLSHDHYDHLDYDSIMKLKDKVRHFCVPLGVGSHLERWGIEKKKITEQDWWAETEFERLRFVSTPARHFSGRSLFDHNATLWCSWAIIGDITRVYFSGDGGYGPHFREIGQKYGPFDLTLMECGQYDQRWSAIHMVPEQTVQAHMDVKGKMLVPIHWAAFSLALHDWTDPIERVIRAAREREMLIATPRIGEPVIVGAVEYPHSVWWNTDQTPKPRTAQQQLQVKRVPN